MKSNALIPFRDIDDYFERLFDPRRWPMAWPLERDYEWRPATDIVELDKEFLFKAELPGVKKEDISVELEGGMLKICGERKEEKEDKTAKMHRVERFQGSFIRSFTVPENVDAKAISADMKEGVLQVHLPKVPVPEPEKTTVEVK